MLDTNRPLLSDGQLKVSVLLKTYNHEKWIAQAVESTLVQKTNFAYEVVIMEDCSTDSTRDIVTDLQRRYPDKIRLVLSEKNKGDHTNFIAAWQSSPSQYIAVLDGDDYWTSPHKLQRQVDFLDTHPECAMCFHNVVILYEEGSQEPWHRKYFPARKKIVAPEALLTEKNFIPSCSPMVRRGLISEFPDWFYDEKFADLALYILVTQHGEIGYIDELMGAYRVHSGGVWSGLSKTQQTEELIRFYKNVSRSVGFEQKNVLDSTISSHRTKLIIRNSSIYQTLTAMSANVGINRIVRRILPMRLHHWLRSLATHRELVQLVAGALRARQRLRTRKRG